MTRLPDGRFWRWTVILVLICAAIPTAWAQQPEVVMQTGHTGAVKSLRFSPDGRCLLSWGDRGVSFGQEQVSILWDLTIYRQVRAFSQSAKGLDFSGYAFSADCHTIATAGPDSVQLRDAISDQVIATLAYPERNPNRLVLPFDIDKRALTFTPEGQFLLGAKDMQVIIWTLPDGRPAHTLTGHTSDISCLAVSPDGKLAASGTTSVGDDLSIRLWDLTTQQAMQKLPGHVGGTTTLAFSPDGSVLASAGQDKTVRLWRVADGHKVAELPGYASAAFTSLIFSRDGRYLLNHTAAVPAEISLWDVESGQEKSLPGWAPKSYATFTPDGTAVVVALEDGAIVVQDLASSAELGRLYHTAAATALAVKSDGDLLAAGDFNGTITLWSLTAAAPLERLEAKADTYTEASFHAAGRLLATRVFNIGMIGQQGGSGLKVWDLNAGKVYPLGNFAVLSPDGSRLAYAAWELGSDPEIRVRDIWQGEEICTVKRAEGDPFGYPGTPALLSPDGTLLLTEDGSNYYVIEVATGNRRSTIQVSTPVEFGAFTADGRFWSAASSGYGTVRVYDTATGQEVRVLQGKERGAGIELAHDGSMAAFLNPERNQLHVVRIPDGATVATLSADRGTAWYKFLFSPKGQLLAAGGGATLSVDLWQIATGKKLRILTGPSTGRFGASLQPLSFSPDETRLVTADSHSGMLHIWETASGHRQYTLNERAQHATYSADGKRLLTWGPEGGARIYDVHTGSLIATVVSFKNDGSVIVTADGFYMTSQEGTDGIAFRQGERLFPFEQFDLHLNRPDVVLRRLGLAPEAVLSTYFQAYTKRLHQLGWSGDKIAAAHDFAVPAVETNLRDVQRVTQEAELPLIVRCTDAEFHLDRLDIRVNGVPLYGTRGLSLRDTLARICERTMLLPLSPGENRIEVSVFNEQGVESLRETASIHYEQPSGMARPPDLYVAALGVSKYQDERFNLRYASKDARDIMTFFRRQEERFGAVHTLLLTDEEVTKEALDRVRRFLTPARFGDQVILFLVVYEGTMEISTLMG